MRQGSFPVQDRENGAIDSGLVDRLDQNADAAAFKVGDEPVELDDVPMNDSSKRWLS